MINWLASDSFLPPISFFSFFCFLILSLTLLLFLRRKSEWVCFQWPEFESLNVEQKTNKLEIAKWKWNIYKNINLFIYWYYYKSRWETVSTEKKERSLKIYWRIHLQYYLLFEITLTIFNLQIYLPETQKYKNKRVLPMDKFDS